MVTIDSHHTLDNHQINDQNEFLIEGSTNLQEQPRHKDPQIIQPMIQQHDIQFDNLTYI